MSWSWTIGRIFGIKLRMHWTFLLLLAYVGFAISQQEEGWLPVVEGILLVLAVFGCVILHECGHALTARRFGVATEDITLLPIGGVARMQRIPSEPWQEFWIAIAGPAVNVVIAFVLFIALAISGHFYGMIDDVGDHRAFFVNLMVINVLLVVFNLIPAFPMDGGRVLRALLATRLDYLQATVIAAKIGQGLAVAFGIAGLLILHNPLLMLVALFVFLGAEGEAQTVRIRTLIGNTKVRDAMMTRFRTLPSTATFQDAVDELLAGSQQDFPIMEGERCTGLLRRQELVSGLKQYGLDASVTTALTPIDESIREDASLQETVEEMRKHQAKAWPVFENGTLVGLLTMENVTELLLVRSAELELDAELKQKDITQAA